LSKPPNKLVPARIRALARAIRIEMAEEFGTDFRGLLLVGSRSRGDDDEQSDVDFEVVVEGAYVCERILHREHFRVELVIRSERLLGESLRRDPFVVERLADAIPIGALHADVEVLCRSASSARPLPRPQPSTIERFVWCRRIRSGLDRANRSKDMLSRVSNRSEALRSAIQLRFALAGRYVPRGRSIGATLSALDAEEGRLVEQFCKSIAAAKAPETFFRKVLAACDPVGDREFGYTYQR
jgi:predicted nucleotidyltransferase